MTNRSLGVFGCLFALLLASSVTSTGSAADVPCPIPQLTSGAYGEIKRALEHDPPVITSTETFLNCLPHEFFAEGNLTYVTRSRSPEQASVTPGFPRTILFGSTAETVIAYTGDPGGPDAEQVRIITSVDGEAPRYQFVSVTFPGGAQAAQIDESSERCAGCHNGHLIWGNYRDWDGTFGRNSDRVWQAKDREEYDAYRHFLRTRANSPRYARAIRSALGSASQAIATDAPFTPRYPYAPGAGDFLRKLAPTHARFIKGRLMASPLYPSYTFLLAATFLGCAWSPDVEADFTRRVVAPFEGETVWGEHQGFLQALTRDPSSDNYTNLLWVSRLSMLGRVLGVSMDEWSVERTHSRAAEAFGPAFDLASGIEIRDYVFREWIAELGQDVEAIGVAFAGPKWNPQTKYSSFLNHRYRHRAAGPDPNHANECAALLPLVDAEVERRALVGDAAVISTPAPERALHVAAPNTPGATSLPAPLARCAACHQPTATAGAAPPIPTGSEDALAAWLRTGEALFVQRVLIDRDMPPGGLSAADRQEVRAFIERVTAHSGG
jgi:mono/diheme cytochrome c family protein